MEQRKHTPLPDKEARTDMLIVQSGGCFSQPEPIPCSTTKFLFSSELQLLKTNTSCVNTDMLCCVLQRIYIPLPDNEAWIDMLKVELEGVPHSLTNTDFCSFAERTHGFSGSDIADAVQDAMYQRFRATEAACFFR